MPGGALHRRDLDEVVDVRRRLPHRVVESAVEVGRLRGAADGHALACERGGGEPAAQPALHAGRISRSLPCGGRTAVGSAVTATAVAAAGDRVLYRILQLEHAGHGGAAGGRTPGPDASAERAGATAPRPVRGLERTGNRLRPLGGGFRERPGHRRAGGRRALGDQRIGERRDDPILRVEQTGELPVDPGALAHLACRHVDEPRGNAKPITDTLIATRDEPPRTEPAAGGQGVVVPVSAIARAACPRVIADHAHAQAAQVARHRLGNPLTNPRVGGLPAQVAKGNDQNRVRRLRGRLCRKPETEPPERQDGNHPHGTLTYRASATRIHREALAGTGKSSRPRGRLRARIVSRRRSPVALETRAREFPQFRVRQAFVLHTPVAPRNGSLARRFGPSPRSMTLRRSTPLRCVLRRRLLAGIHPAADSSLLSMSNAPRRTQRSARCRTNSSTETSTKSRCPSSVSLDWRPV